MYLDILLVNGGMHELPCMHVPPCMFTLAESRGQVTKYISQSDPSSQAWSVSKSVPQGVFTSACNVNIMFNFLIAFACYARSVQKPAGPRDYFNF